MINSSCVNFCKRRSKTEAKSVNTSLHFNLFVTKSDDNIFAGYRYSTILELATNDDPSFIASSSSSSCRKIALIELVIPGPQFDIEYAYLSKNSFPSDPSLPAI